MFRNIQAVIFDLDGTLIDSMVVWNEIDIEYLGTLGLGVPTELKNEISHLSFFETANYFINRFNIDTTSEDLMQLWNEMAFHKYSTSIKLKHGAKEFLEYLKSTGIKAAIATSNNKLLVETVLTNNSVIDYFENITTTDEVGKGKGSPDVYIRCAEKMKIHTSNCLVFEDILSAVKTAKSAGMKVVGVYDEYSDGDAEEIKMYSDYFISSYHELL